MTRLVSGVILALVALAAILFLPFNGLRVVACIVAALAAHEYLRIAGCDGSGMVGAVVACWFVAAGHAEDFLIVSVLMILTVVYQVMVRNAAIQSAAAAAVATLYIGVPLGMLATLQRVYGPTLTLLAIATVVVSDTSQYYTGRAFGRHHLAPTISPKKTIEGAIGGVILGSAFVAIAGWYVYKLPPRTTIPFGIVVVVFGIIGDLFESRIKRQRGVKDSSSLIPGHGGILDRIDALLFATPAFYVYFTS